MDVRYRNRNTGALFGNNRHFDGYSHMEKVTVTVGADGERIVTPVDTGAPEPAPGYPVVKPKEEAIDTNEELTAALSAEALPANPTPKPRARRTRKAAR